MNGNGEVMAKSSRWTKDVKKALIDREMTQKQLAECLGFTVATVNAVLAGKYPNKTGRDIVRKINETLGTTGGPERLNTAPKDWCTKVRVRLQEYNLDGRQDNGMTIGELAENVGATRDKVSNIINGRQWDADIAKKIAETLGIGLPTLPSAS